MPTTRSAAQANAERFKTLRSALHLEYTGKQIPTTELIHTDMDLKSTRSYSPKIFKPSSSRLLNLPSEIRHMIFTLAVTEDKRLFLDTLMPPPLCRASKQIRSETLALFLHCNEFHVVVAEYLGRFAAEFSPVTRIWLQEINVKAPLVANLRITFMPHEVDPHHFPAGLWDPAIVDLTYATDADRVILQHSGTSCRFCQPSKASSEASANLNLNLSPQHPVSQAVSQIVASIQAFTAQINADYHAFLKRRHDSNLQGFQNLFGLLTADGRRLSIVNICQFARGPESVRRNRAQETVQ